MGFERLQWLCCADRMCLGVCVLGGGRGSEDVLEGGGRGVQGALLVVEGRMERNLNADLIVG